MFKKMFKKMIVASAILGSSFAFANGAYKGENYKGEVAAPAPCPTCQFLAGPYVGFSIGSRTNWQHNRNVFKGISGIVSLGYAAMITPMWYIGAEFFAGDTARLSSKNHDNLRSTWDYGLDLVPGVMIADCVLGYVRGGVIRTQFKSRHNSGRTGWRVGLGAEATICQNWDGRIEYVYNQYPKQSGGHHNHHRKVQAEQFNIGAVYKFL